METKNSDIVNVLCKKAKETNDKIDHYGVWSFVGIMLLNAILVALILMFWDYSNKKIDKLSEQIEILTNNKNQEL